MLKWFSGGSKVQKLEKQYAKLMKESHQLSKVDRNKADQKFAEAESVMDEIEKLKADTH